LDQFPLMDIAVIVAAIMFAAKLAAAARRMSFFIVLDLGFP
jgi:hypothetical protein